MTKKDYERAAEIVQHIPRSYEQDFPGAADTITDVFVEFFCGDNPRFDEPRFRAACVPGANVKARGKRDAA